MPLEVSDTDRNLILEEYGFSEELFKISFGKFIKILIKLGIAYR